MPDTETLDLFLHLAATLHFGRTSHECHVSPSTLSRSISRLEAELGAPLFARDSRRVALTEAGERFRTYASEAAARWDDVQREVRETSAPLHGSLRIYCTVTASQSIVPGILARFRGDHPEVRIELDTGYASDALELVEDGRVAVSIAALPDRLPKGVVAREIASTSLVFVASRSQSSDIDWSEVPVVLPSHGLARQRADRWFKSRGVNPNVYSEVEGHEAVLSLVALGCGVGVVPLLVLEKSALRRDVRSLDVDPPLPPFRIGVCVLKRALNEPLVRAFWATLP
jgi:LysR family positive regulator for ilvC